jgi:hypothetical protein
VTKLYVIQSESGHVKVGISSDPEKRRKCLEESGPFRLSLVHVLDDALASDIERVAHKILKGKRMRGEWYDIAPGEAISAITTAISDISENGIRGGVTSLRIPEELKDWAKKQAQSERRSLGNWILKLMEDERARLKKVRK